MEPHHERTANFFPGSLMGDRSELIILNGIFLGMVYDLLILV